MTLNSDLFRPLGGIAALALALLLSACGGTEYEDKGCSPDFEPVCAYVEPSFCGLGPGKCGNFRQTFDNACWARKAQATDLQIGACKPTGQGPVPDPRDGPNAAPQLGFQPPAPPPGFLPTDNPYSEARLGEMYTRHEDGLKMTGAKVETRKGRNNQPEVVLIVSGTMVSGCKQANLKQSARIGDSFGVSLRTIDLKEFGKTCGKVEAFTKSLRLDPGPTGFDIGERYEVVVNGRPGSFTVQDPAKL